MQAGQARHLKSGYGKIVTISNICHKVTISDNQCSYTCYIDVQPKRPIAAIYNNTLVIVFYKLMRSKLCSGSNKLV